MSEVLEQEGWIENAIGEKFNAKGEVLPFRGNTLICHLEQDSEIVRVTGEMVDAMKAAGLGRCYAFLPQSSYHMTVFSGANDRARHYPAWPQDLNLDASMEECDRLFAAKLANFRLMPSLPLQMRIGAIALKRGVSLSLAPLDRAEERKIRSLRDALSRTLNCKRNNHDVYEFHVSVSYLINKPNDEALRLLQILRAGYLEKLMRVAPVMTLGAPEFCTFRDMSRYTPLLRLE
ncbi:DUF1868 domain-containing protein [Pantoea ananatis]|uniref:DUF1868 domain-containing protein n=1 Tax=Pantoea ananas TaxID=553 RepID=A0A8A4K0A8_PANAN|nr:DUF1868 domain-containing protein [Pantoea ananatis]NQE78938.1 hypothetical protein [Pantoea ananatis]NQE82840.1 hypothetical protein [Pantoea ananatis]PQK89417.1 hypothetical protein CG432_12055 [Pantoea ananatis]PWV93748.1 hypothetical protein C7426_1011289 [Pantoea ananatis]QTC45324.1 DUF1868 domain-containing protein [Pantoea ananatis]